MYTARAVGADEQVFVRARENAMQSHNRSRLGAAVGRRLGRSKAIVCVSAWALLHVACDSVPVGPSLTNVTFSGLNGASIQTNAGWRASQLPTVVLSNLTRDPSVCCCHIRGTVTNTNTVPVHVIVQFAAMDPNQVELARIVNFAQDLQAGASYRLPDDGPGAAGFLLPCTQIDHVNFQLNVTSLAPPPFI
jgi:hypothetical protein